LSRLVSELVDPGAKRGFITSCRVKSPTSFVEKALRKKYPDPFQQIHDQVGLRVVVFFDDEVEEVCQKIEEHFDVDEKNSVDKKSILKANETGYQSVHKIVNIDATRASLTDWADFQGIKAEIQVRTFLQHAWAQIEHGLNYKKTSNAPKSLIRRLNNLSALLEVADGEFLRIRDDIRTIVAGYKQQVESGNLDLEINLDSLREYLTSSSAFKHLEFCSQTSEHLLPTILERVSQLENLNSFRQIDSLIRELLYITSARGLQHEPFLWVTPAGAVYEALSLICEAPELLGEGLSEKTRSLLIENYVNNCRTEYEEQLVSPWDD